MKSLQFESICVLLQLTTSSRFMCVVCIQHNNESSIESLLRYLCNTHNQYQPASASAYGIIAARTCSDLWILMTPSNTSTLSDWPEYSHVSRHHDTVDKITNLDCYKLSIQDHNTHNVQSFTVPILVYYHIGHILLGQKAPKASRSGGANVQYRYTQ